MYLSLSLSNPSGFSHSLSTKKDWEIYRVFTLFYKERKMAPGDGTSPKESNQALCSHHVAPTP